MQRFVPVARRKNNRLAFIAGVAATHAALIVTFLMNDTIRMPEHLSTAKEITLILRRIIPAVPQQAPPQAHVPRVKSNAITLPPFLQNNPLQRLGRTLACRSDTDNLSPEERAHCAAQPWTAPDSTTQLMLSAEQPSIWAQELAERKAPFVSMFNPCKLGEGPDAERGRLGLTCMQTDPEQAKRWGKLLQ